MNNEPIPFVPDLTVHPEVVPFFDPATNTISYIVRDPNSSACAVIDSVMDFDYASGSSTPTRSSTSSATRAGSWSG